MKIAVIGAGPSGLVSLKELLEAGHSVTCFEKQDDLGGVFYYGPGRGAVYDSTLLTVSNYFMAFSSFPPKEVQRRYWTHEEYFEYLKAFSDHFNLRPHIRFNTLVSRIDMTATGATLHAKQWGGETDAEDFDAVVVSTGTHQIPKYPEFCENSIFEGEVHHAKDYKNASSFRGKRVVCVGIGETAADVTYEIGVVAKSCVLSMRHYPAIVARYEGRHTNDTLTSRLMYALPKHYLNRFIEKEARQMKRRSSCAVERELAEWVIKCGGLFNHFLTKNERFLSGIVDKKITVNSSGIKSLTRRGVLFNDGTEVEADCVMCNTGYQEDFSFIKGVSVTDVKSLYLHMLHPEVGKRLALIGWARPAVGGIPACSEMQARFFARLCNDEIRLPTAAELEIQIEQDRRAEEHRFNRARSIRTLVHYSGYMDKLAGMVGCLPRWRGLFYRFPLLYHYVCGSQVSYQYRLCGPGANYRQASRIICRLPVGWSFKQGFKLALANLYYGVLDLFVKGEQHVDG